MNDHDLRWSRYVQMVANAERSSKETPERRDDGAKEPATEFGRLLSWTMRPADVGPASAAQAIADHLNGWTADELDELGHAAKVIARGHADRREAAPSHGVTDAEVAMDVMGFSWYERDGALILLPDSDSAAEYGAVPSALPGVLARDWDRDVPAFTTTRVDDVVDRMLRDGWMCSLHSLLGGGYKASFFRYGTGAIHLKSGATIAAAMCAAAVAAVRHESARKSEAT